MKKNIPPTFREMIEKAIVELSEFKIELTDEDMIAFNKIIDIVRKKILSNSGEPFLPGKFDPVDFLLLSILIEQQKEIDALKEAIKIVKERSITPPSREGLVREDRISERKMVD